jgi:branched-chain amino acid transport system ATP-binding protein
MSLVVNELSARYGSMTALRKVSLTVTQGTVIALIGANGVGKSTLLNSIVGLHTRTSGNVDLEGKPIRGKSAHEIARMGIGLVPEGRHLFPELTVRENLRMGMHGLKVSNRETGSREDEVFELFPILGDFSNRMAGLLSGGQQQMLALGRVLASEPRVLLADELSLGLAPMVVERLLAAVRAAADQGVAVILVEQHVRQALAVADRVHVLRRGRVVMSGDAGDLRDDAEGIAAHYLTGDAS